jgi:thiol-disulfide isomerase/thioredoxin
MWGFALLSLLACVPPRVAQQLSLLEARMQVLEQVAGIPTPATPAAEAAAERLLAETLVAADDLRWDDAKARCGTLTSTYGNTASGIQAGRVCGLWAVIGRPAADYTDVQSWFVGAAPSPGTQLLVFAEEWCPHCQRELPKVQEVSIRWKDRLQVVGLTQVTRSATDDSVRAWVQQAGVTFPFGKESGALSEHYGVQGIPAAALVRDDVVIWRGHPAQLDDVLLEKLLR